MSLFVTGTDTDVGKTILATAIALGRKAFGESVAPMKPVQTGCVHGKRTRAPDLDFALHHLDQDFEEEMLPYAFDPPCSPHLAAARAKQDIEIPVVTNAYAALQSRHKVVVVEGAGGILVPLNPREMMLDLMVALDLPVILAARPALGTLNHTLLSLRTLRDAGLKVLGFATVDTTPREWGFIEEDNIATLITRGETVHLGHIPFSETLSTSFLETQGIQIVTRCSVAE